MKIAAIIVLYNPDQTVIKNIRTYSDKVDYVILIDNSSINNASLFDNSFFYLSLCKNYGIAKALNIGIEKARELNCDWVLTMDQDSQFVNNIIEVYKNYLLRRGGKDKIAILSPHYLFDRNKLKKCPYDKEIKLTMQSANLLLVKAFDSIGKFNEQMFIDGVDYDYCFRARKKGYKIIYCHDALIQHQPAKTCSFNIFNLTILKYGIAPPIRYYYQARNLMYLAIHYFSGKMFVLLSWKLFKILFFFPQKMRYLSFFFNGLHDYFHGFWGEYDESQKYKI